MNTYYDYQKCITLIISKIIHSWIWFLEVVREKYVRAFNKMLYRDLNLIPFYYSLTKMQLKDEDKNIFRSTFA